MVLHEIISISLIILGTILMVLAAVGIIRLPDFFIRMSAITKAATLGLFLLLIGLMLHFNNLELTVKSCMIIGLVLLTNPVGAHAIGRAAYMDGIEIWKGTILDELKDMTERKNELEKLLEESPDDTEVLTELAELYRKLPTAQGGDLEKAQAIEKKLG